MLTASEPVEMFRGSATSSTLETARCVVMSIIIGDPPKARIGRKYKIPHGLGSMGYTVLNTDAPVV